MQLDWAATHIKLFKLPDQHRSTEKILQCNSKHTDGKLDYIIHKQSENQPSTTQKGSYQHVDVTLQRMVHAAACCASYATSAATLKYYLEALKSMVKTRYRHQQS
jgi:hypothetical protein